MLPIKHITIPLLLLGTILVPLVSSQTTPVHSDVRIRIQSGVMSTNATCLTAVINGDTWAECALQLKTDFTKVNKTTVTEAECCEYWGQFECLKNGLHEQMQACSTVHEAVLHEFEVIQNASLDALCSPHHCNLAELNLTNGDQWQLSARKDAKILIDAMEKFPNCSLAQAAHLAANATVELCNPSKLTANQTNPDNGEIDAATCKAIYHDFDCQKAEVHSELTKEGHDCKEYLVAYDKFYDAVHGHAQQYLCNYKASAAFGVVVPQVAVVLLAALLVVAFFNN